jgi:hypothetical protein
MLRRHVRLFGLLGLLATLVFMGCRSAPRRGTQLPATSPLGAPAAGASVQPPAPPLPQAGPTLAINDTAPLQAPVLADQKPPAAKPPQPNAGPYPTVQPSAVPVGNGAPNKTPTAAASPLRTLHRLCVEKYATLSCYEVLLRRREVVNGEKKPEELLQFKFRKEPFSVYFKCLSEAGQGREVVFVKGRYNNQMHVLTGKGDAPWAMRKSFAPTDPMVMSRSRHPITEAGLGNLIDSFGTLVDGTEAGDPRAGSLKYLGQPVQRPEYPGKALEAVHQTIPPGREPQLPRGGQRWWFFDMTLRLPVLVIAVDDRGQEVEYYAHDRFQVPPQGLSEEHFSPDNLGRRRN